MKFSSIKFKVISTIIVSLALGALAIIFLFNLSYQSNINLIAQQSVKSSEEAFNNLETNDTNMLSSTLGALLQNDTYKQAYLAKDRDKLYQLTSPLFKELKEKYRITHWYFLNPEPDSKAFLRVHKPKTFDDVIKRVTYRNSVKSKDYAAGKELGKTAFALRVVHPYYDNGKLIGYMELGEEIDHFLQIMKKQTGNDFGLLLKKSNLDEKEWATMRESKKQANNWNDYKDVVLVDKTTEDTSIINYNKDIESVPDGGLVLEEVKKGNSVFIRGIFPIYDAANKKVGGVFVLRDITEIHNQMQSMKNKTLLFIGALMILISLIIIIMFNKLIIQRLNGMIDVATRVVGGEFNTPINPSADDEIGKFESLFEQFRKVFVSLVTELENKNKN